MLKYFLKIALKKYSGTIYDFIVKQFGFLAKKTDSSIDDMFIQLLKVNKKYVVTAMKHNVKKLLK